MVDETNFNFIGHCCIKDIIYRKHDLKKEKNNDLVNREVIHLSEREHILLRPAMYVGTTEMITKTVPIFEDGLLVKKEINYSDGFYRLLDEVIDNAFDEALRCKKEGYEFKKISVNINSNTNKVIVSDDGRGFMNPNEINITSGLTNVETAVSLLRAGSNFQNDKSDVTVIGTNGVGLSAVNMLSDLFEVETTNSGYIYEQQWLDFVTEGKTYEKSKTTKGTTITYIARKKSFKNIKFDKEFVFTKCLFRNFSKLNDDNLRTVEFELIWDKEVLDLNIPLLPSNSFHFKLNKYTELYIWEAIKDKTTSISFVNGSLCGGFHQTFYQEKINERLFSSKTASEFYETAIIINLPPKHVQFQEQNKNRFIVSRAMMEELMPFKPKEHVCKDFIKSDLYENIIIAIENKNYSEDLKKIKRNKKKNKQLIFSDKFIPSKNKSILFITEGGSSKAAISSQRDPVNHSIYALKGKIKNARHLSDLSNNQEIIDLMNILNLNVEDGGKTCTYDKVVITSDMDCLDGMTLIKTDSGDKHLKDVTYDDMVLGSDNNFHKINQIIKTTKDRIFEFIVNGEVIRCSENHIFYIYRDNEVIQEKAKNIKKTDCFLIKK